MKHPHTKVEVKGFWGAAACGEELYLPTLDRAGYAAQSEMRYAIEPDLLKFARVETGRGKRVLEIGVGLGADHQKFAEAGADLFGADLPERAVRHTKRRFAVFGLESGLAASDAEDLAFRDDTFDLVYSWGVLHHSPDTERAIAEVWRVVRPGGVARVMIYHKWSLVGLMLWVRYALFTFRPWLSLNRIYSEYLESPGTKAYTVTEARGLFSRFSDVKIGTRLCPGDLIEAETGQRHGGPMLSLARRVWPRAFIRKVLPGIGLVMLVEARRPT